MYAVISKDKDGPRCLKITDALTKAQDYVQYNVYENYKYELEICELLPSTRVIIKYTPPKTDIEFINFKENN